MRTTVGRWVLVVPVLIALLVAGEARSQEAGAQVLVGFSGYEDLQWPVGFAGQIGLPWGGLEVAASWSRDDSNRRGVPCAGLIPPESTECVEQEMDVTGTMATASVGRPVALVGERLRLSAVPSVAFAAVEAERRGTDTDRRISADRRLLRLGLAAELRGPLSTGGEWGYSGRLYGGSLVSGGPRCVDCFEPFRDGGFEARLSLGITYRWSR